MSDIKDDDDPEQNTGVLEKEKSDLGKDSSDDEGDDPDHDAIANSQTSDGSKTIETNKEKETATKKGKSIDWPLKNIEEPHDNDVLYGRGGGTNHHAGNKRYRKMVEDRKLDYVNSKRLDKPLVALSIIREWRAQDPPGRFLKIDEKSGLWNDVGDKKAREKTSQALREKAPLIRKQQEEERVGKDRSDDDDDEDEKRTRFADGTNTEPNSSDAVKKATLARDHSLGREYLGEGEAVTLDGFSWQDPLESNRSLDDISKFANGGHPGPPPQAPAVPTTNGNTHTRMPSHNSFGPDHFRYPSQGSMGPPPSAIPPYLVNDERLMRFSSHERYESWSSLPSGPPPPMPGYGYGAQCMGSWSRENSAHRDHSLSQLSLPHASVCQPAPYAFDSRHGSTSSWGAHPLPSTYSPVYHTNGPAPPPPPPPHIYSKHALRESSHDYNGHRSGPPSPPYRVDSRDFNGQRCGPPSPPYPLEIRDHNGQHRRPGSSGPPSPPYAVDPDVASKWSGQPSYEIAKTWSHGSNDEVYDGFNVYDNSSIEHSPRSAPFPRPDMVKRATSNQNETCETKPDLRGPSVKRAALNRDSSAAANRLKELYVPGYKESNPFNAEREVNQLTDNLEQSTLSSSLQRQAISSDDRTPTFDSVTREYILKPVSFTSINRVSTLDALGLDLDCKPIKTKHQRNPTLDEPEAKVNVQKPSTISTLDRMTTNEYYDIVNAPIEEDEDFDLVEKTLICL